MVRTTLLLEEETAEALKRLADLQGRSAAEVIRDALAAYTSKAERPSPKGVGAYRSGRSDVSERAEDLLREAAHRSR